MAHRPLLLTLTIVFGIAVLAAGIAGGAEKPVVVKAGNLVLTLNGGVSPKALPKSKPAPISLNVSGKIATADGTHPPAVGTVTIDFDKNGTTNAKGLPKCASGKLQARTTAAAKAACPNAIVGSGSTKVEVEFAEQAPFTASGPLVLFNGGVSGGTTTMYIHAYVAVPAPTALVTVVKIKKVSKGRFGTRAVASIPVVAGGSGSVTDFSLTINRRFTSGGKKQSYVVAKCPDGKLVAHADLAFRGGGPKIAGTVSRACRSKG